MLQIRQQDVKNVFHALKTFLKSYLVSLSSVYYNVFISFKYFNFVQERWVFKFSLQIVPDENSNILSCTNDILEVWNVFVQVFVIHRCHDAVVHVFLEVVYIHHHSCVRSNRSSQSDFNCKITRVRYSG